VWVLGLSENPYQLVTNPDKHKVGSMIIHIVISFLVDCILKSVFFSGLYYITLLQQDFVLLRVCVCVYVCVCVCIYVCICVCMCYSRILYFSVEGTWLIMAL
jgi:hypothetical protein